MFHHKNPLQRTTRLLASLGVLLGALALVACGGGGGGSTAMPTATHTPPADPVIPIPPANPGGGEGGGQQDPGGGDPGGGDPQDPPQDPPAPVVPQPPAPETDFAGLTAVRGIAADAQTGDAWMFDEQDGTLYRLQSGDSAPTPMANVALTGVRGLAVMSGVDILYVVADGGIGDDVLVAVDLGTFQPTSVGTITGRDQLESLVHDPVAGLLSVDTATGELISISHTDATPALIGALGGVYGDIRGLTYDAGEATVYGLDRTAEQVVSIDTQTGAARRMTRLPNTTLDAFAYVGNSERFLVASTTTPVVGERDLMGKRFPYAEIRGTAYNPDADVLFGAHTGYGIIVEIEPDSGWKRMIAYHAVPSVEGIAYDATGGLIHAVSSSQASLVTINAGSFDVGAGQSVDGAGGPWTAMRSLTMGQGSLYAIDDATGDVVQINPANATATQLGSLGTGLGIQAVTYRDGNLYAYSNAMQQEIVIDLNAPSTANPLAGGANGMSNVVAMAWREAGPMRYGVDATGNALVLFEDQTPPTLALDQVRALAHNPADGALLAFDLTTEAVHQLDPSDQSHQQQAAVAGASIDGMAADPNTGQIYMAEANSQSLLVLDGAMNLGIVGNSGDLGTTGIRAMAWHIDNGGLYAIDGSDLVHVNVGTAAVTTIGATGYAQIEALTWDDDRKRLLGIDAATGHLVAIDAQTGAAVQMGTVPAGDFRSMSYNAQQQVLEVVDLDTQRVLRLDPVTGALVP